MSSSDRRAVSGNRNQIAAGTSRLSDATIRIAVHVLPTTPYNADTDISPTIPPVTDTRLVAPAADERIEVGNSSERYADNVTSVPIEKNMYAIHSTGTNSPPNE